MKKTIVLSSISTVILSIAFTLVFTFIITFERAGKGIYKSCQPNFINYQSFDPYCLHIVEHKRILGKRYSIVIGVKGPEDDKEIPSYGYRIPFPFEHKIDDIDMAVTEWQQEGLNLKMDDGSSLFIVKRSYIGGR